MMHSFQIFCTRVRYHLRSSTRMQKLTAGIACIGVIGCIVGCVCAGFAVVVYHNEQTRVFPPISSQSSYEKNDAEKQSIEMDATSSAIVDATASSPSIAVSVGGAVAKPGIISLPAGSRVADALREAGGVTKQANGAWVSKNIKLAEHIQDETHLYIPFADEELQEDVKTQQKNQQSESGLSLLNNGSQQSLLEIKGIGEVKAACIVEKRPFQSIDDAMNACSLSQSIIDAL